MPYKHLLLLAFFWFSSVGFSQEKDYDRDEIVALTKKADDYLTELKFKESLLYSREALKRAVYIKDDYLIAKSYNTIAGSYDELSEYEKAIQNYKKALSYAQRAGDDTLVGLLNNNLGNMYFFQMKDISTGAKYYERAIAQAELTADTARIVLSNLNLAWGYFESGKFAEGELYLKYINQHFDRNGTSDTEAVYFMVNGMYYSHQRDYSKAESFFQQAIAAAKNHQQEQDLSYCYEQYAEHLLAQEKYKLAYQYLALHHKLTSEIYDRDKLQKADLEGVNVQLDEYRRALDKIETERKLQELRLRKSRVIMILFVVGLVFLLVMLYLVYKNYVFKQKMNLELTSANEALQIAKDKAEEASQLKSQFVSTISHELRTPLYGVVGITNMIMDEHKELAGSMHLNSLKFSAKYLLSLVNDILQINKIEENRLVLENLTFNIADEITTIKDSLQFIANKNNNVMSVEIDTDIPEIVIGDKLRLSQIFMNLVSNALKFTKNGEVVVSAILERVEGKMHFIKFCVRDSGIGIAKEDQAKIFEKFVQIERKNDDYQGTGLGLSIVKRLISLFGSEIHLESDEKIGTAFTFTIGFEVDPEKTIEIINNIEVDLTSGHIFSVLVVEDNKINQLVTRRIIEKNNYTCSVVDDGHAALEVLSIKEFDVILMDINMPGINGFETARQIRSRGIETPIIALTAFGKEEITEEAISSGMNDIIIKPFEPAQLFQVIHGQISKAKSVS